MKKNIFIIIFVTISTLFFAKQTKVLISNFANVNKDPQYEFIKGNIADAVYAKLSQEGKFKVAILSDEDSTIPIDDSSKVMRYAFNNKYDLIISGYYYTHNDDIRIHFTVDDVVTGRNKITYSQDGGVGIEIYSLIENSTKVLIKRMTKEIKPYPEEFIDKQRSKRKSQIFGNKIDFLFLLDANVVVNLNPVFSFSNDFKTATIFTGSENILIHFFWETPNKKDYLGFGMLFTVPMMINTSYLDLHYSLFLSYAYAKRFFFDFTLDAFVFQQDNISTNYQDVDFSINDIYLTSYFYFTYMFPNEKFSITTGVSVPLNIVTPKHKYADNSEERTNQGLNTITFLLDNDKNSGIPISDSYTVIVSNSVVIGNAHFAFAYYPNAKLGFNFKSDFSFVYIDTGGIYNNANETIGQAFEVTIKLSLGISFKGKYALTFASR